MTGLVDGDIIAYRCAVSCEKRDKLGAIIALDDVDIAIARTESMIHDILDKEENIVTYLTGGDNFRYKINPEYKANRKGKPDPTHLASCQDYLIKEYGAIVTNGYEADDALGMAQTEGTVIYSIDKDLLMIPGHHFNFITGKYCEVSELDGLKQFYRQMLIGDTADNIKGVDGIGKVKSAKLIDHLTSEEEMHKVVFGLYHHPTCPLIEDTERFWMNANCLWIMRKEGETFENRVAGHKLPSSELVDSNECI